MGESWSPDISKSFLLKFGFAEIFSRNKRPLSPDISFNANSAVSRWKSNRNIKFGKSPLALTNRNTRRILSLVSCESLAPISAEKFAVIVSSPETSHGLNSTAVTVRYFCSVSFSKTKFFTEDLPEPHPPYIEITRLSCPCHSEIFCVRSDAKKRTSYRNRR